MKFFLILMVAGFSALAQAVDLSLIHVNGMAEKTVEPNLIQVRLESWTKAPTAAAAQEQQALQYTKVKAALEKFKIKKEDIQTEGFSVTPDYVWDQKASINRVTGYRVSHSVLVIYRKIDESGPFLDSLVYSKNDTSGVSVQNISWDYDKKADVEKAALGDAIRNARSKAEELAKAAGVEIRGVHKIQYNSYNSPAPQPMFEKAAMMRMSSDMAAPATELSSGQIKVKVEVQMEFEI